MEKEIKNYPIEFYTTKRNKYNPFVGTKVDYRWRVTADNGRIIGASTQGYSNLEDCVYNAQSVGLSLMEHNYE